jgi:glycosyltransferase involved in cell wall biosynthesis
MPVKNEERFIEAAINSVLNQTYSNFELIIINDGSTDATSEKVKLFNDKRIILIETKGVGKNKAFNLGFEVSKGKFICYFAGDDVLVSDSLENRVLPIENKDNQAISTVTKVKTISEIKKFDGVITPKADDKGSMLGGTIMFTKVLADLIFPLPEILPNEDKWTVEHIKYFSEVIHVPKVGINYRIHENNSSSRTNPFHLKTEAMHKRFIVFGLFLEKYRSRLNDENIRKLESLSAAEILRYNNNSLSILLMSGLSLSEKLRCFFHSKAFLYWIRIQLFSLLSGRS